MGDVRHDDWVPMDYNSSLAGASRTSNMQGGAQPPKKKLPVLRWHCGNFGDWWENGAVRAETKTIGSLDYTVLLTA